jgi:quercetin dioxygenase-like cupin family protein
MKYKGFVEWEDAQKIEKPWGFEIHWALTDKYCGKLLFIKAGHRLSKQYHEVKEETIFVLKGPLYHYDEEDKITKLVSGDTIHIAPGQIHRFGANECNVELIEVSTPELDDVVRLEDDYSR